MNKSDYDKYYKKGGTYVIPVEVFNELFDELDKKDNIINELVKFMDEDYEYYKKYGSAEQGYAMGQIRRIKNKLQELKGDDKE